MGNYIGNVIHPHKTLAVATRTKIFQGIYLFLRIPEVAEV